MKRFISQALKLLTQKGRHEIFLAREKAEILQNTESAIKNDSPKQLFHVYNQAVGDSMFDPEIRLKLINAIDLIAKNHAKDVLIVGLNIMAYTKSDEELKDISNKLLSHVDPGERDDAGLMSVFAMVAGGVAKHSDDNALDLWKTVTSNLLAVDANKAFAATYNMALGSNPPHLAEAGRKQWRVLVEKLNLKDPFAALKEAFDAELNALVNEEAGYKLSLEAQDFLMHLPN